MPYLHVFVLGEALRQGVMGAPEKRVGVQVFLFLISITQYAFFAPLYWFWMYRRWRGRPITHPQRPAPVIDCPDA